MTLNIRILNLDEAKRLAPQLGEILADCVNGGASVSFMLPFTSDDGMRFFDGVATRVASREALLLCAFRGDVPVGTVQVHLVTTPNQPHRADVAKMLVHSSARRLGVAEALMLAAEEAAAKAGRTLLVLDTVTGSAADRLYTKLGWVRVGEIPDYALWPQGGQCPTTVFYKRVG